MRLLAHSPRCLETLYVRSTSSLPTYHAQQDDVERALAREIAHLHAVTAQINHKANSIDKELENLEIAAATIEDNIRSVNQSMTWECARQLMCLLCLTCSLFCEAQAKMCKLAACVKYMAFMLFC